MTLIELKEALATYGVNEQERTTPIVVRVVDPRKVGRDYSESEQFYVVTEAEVIYDSTLPPGDPWNIGATE
jgi:hypothetical protein